MLFWTIQTAIASFIFIFLVHYLINFFKSTLTVPKIKDLVNTPTQKYENIYKIISHSQNQHTKSNQNDKKNNVPYDITDLLPTTSATNNVLTSSSSEKNNMKNELKNFLKSQITPQASSSSSAISDLIGSSHLGNSSSGISFSEF